MRYSDSLYKQQPSEGAPVAITKCIRCRHPIARSFTLGCLLASTLLVSYWRELFHVQLNQKRASCSFSSGRRAPAVLTTRLSRVSLSYSSKPRDKEWHSWNGCKLIWSIGRVTSPCLETNYSGIRLSQWYETQGFYYDINIYSKSTWCNNLSVSTQQRCNVHRSIRSQASRGSMRGFSCQKDDMSNFHDMEL